MNNYFEAIKNDESIPDELRQDADYFIDEVEELTADQLQVIASAMYSVLPAKEKIQTLRMIKIYKEGDINEK